MEMMPGISSAAVRETIRCAIHAFVGHGKHISFDELAADTGDKARTLRSYAESGGPMPPPDALLRIAAALHARGAGSQFMTRIIGVAGLTAAHVDDDDGAANVHHALNAAAGITHMIAHELSDGQLCQGGKRRIGQEIRDKIPILIAAADDGGGP